MIQPPKPKMPKFNAYTGGGLKGTYMITRKLDGVCAILDARYNVAESKAGKPLHNFEEVLKENLHLCGKFEVFRENWETSVSLVRTENSPNKVKLSDLFQVDPPHHSLIIHSSWTDPSHEDISRWMKEALARGDEGLVLYPLSGCPSKKPTKVKQVYTIDVRVTDIVEAKGQFKCMLGKFKSAHGDIGTGYDLNDRYSLFHPDMVGEIIEVSFMEWTPNGKMRHARFERWRWDKDTENLEGRKLYE